MRNVAIFGVGLIGGSFALAIKRAGFDGRILGVSSSSTVTEALRLGVIDEAVSAEAAAATADVIYLAQPIRQILATISWLAGRLKPGALVTDAGSTKREIVELACRTLGPHAFLGGHPMAGKELRGVGAAEAGLFEKRTYFLCPGESDLLQQQPFAGELVHYVKRMGALPVVISAEEHDELVSLTSHLPQMASTALASCLAQRLAPDSARNGAGPGLVDMTRLAQSSFDLWADILFTNAKSVDRALGLYIDELNQIRDLLNRSNAGGTFERAASFAGLVRKPKV